MSDLDVYRDWLGIQDTNRPLNYYQLLRLKKFEDDTEKIRAQYRKLNAHVRKYAAGQYGEQSQQLLNELARAMLCLTDAKRKAEYDASLGRKEEAKLGRSLEELLVRRKVVTSAQLDKARNYSLAVGVEIREALVQQKLAPQEAVMQAYADSVGVPFIDLDDIGIDESLVPQVPALIARTHSCAPVMVDDGQLLMASPNLIPPDIEEELRLRIGLPIRIVLCTGAQIHAVIDKYFPREAAEAELAAGGQSGKRGKPSKEPAAKDTAAPQAGANQPSTDKADKTDPDQHKLVIPLIVALLAFMPVLAVLNFWNPFRSGPTDVGPMEYGIAGLVGAAAGFVAYLFGPRK
jgi:hypothetical protein